MVQYVQSTINKKIPTRYIIIIKYYKTMDKNENLNRSQIKIIRNQNNNESTTAQEVIKTVLPSIFGGIINSNLDLYIKSNC